MNTEIRTHSKWFWPWQDDKEEAWLEQMSREGWHLRSVRLLCSYTFAQGPALPYTYRLDYFPASGQEKFAEYAQLFRDAGWEYLGELSNWRYWRKLVEQGETAEIFTDRESKLSKYRRLLGFLTLLLVILSLLGSNLLLNARGFDADTPDFIRGVYTFGRVSYAVIIPLYVFIIVKILRRMNQLKIIFE